VPAPPLTSRAVGKRILTPQAEDFPQWYQDVVSKAELAENGPVRGTMVIRPWAYAIWERVQAELDARIKATGTRNAYFPLLIPESYLKREAEHVEGFSPELAVVTYGGGKALEEPVVLRPTSETIINSYFAKWISSYRDLPLKVNNWSNVVRWELRPRLFLRTTEFLWQEGHTAHETSDEARAFALRVLTDVYAEVMRDVMAVPVYTGRKTDRERFAGATCSWTCEGMMRDGKALQMGTSHELGQAFSKAFGTFYSGRDGNRHHPWQTSWGASTRLLGALIMVHGDDNGLRLPPRVAPTQVVVLAIKDGPGVMETAASLTRELEAAGLRVDCDDDTDVSFGRRVVGWELKGVPARIEIGPRDLLEGRVTLVSRVCGTKSEIAIDNVLGTIGDALEADQRALEDEARAFRDDMTTAVSSIADAAEVSRTGFARMAWSQLGVEGEAQLAEHGVSVRCLVGPDGGHPLDLAEADALLARAY
jgi:prolyl-tRNA synthetase